MSDQTKQLSMVLDTLLEQESHDRTQDLNSLNALLNTVLPAFTNKKLKIEEEQVVLKIFSAIEYILSINPSLVTEDNKFITIIKQIQQFYNSNYHSEKLSNAANFTLIQILNNGFGSKLRNNKYIFQIRDLLIESIESNLKYLLSTITNSNFSNSVLDITDFHNTTDSKFARLSISIRTLQVLLDSNIYELFMLRMQNSILIDSFISRIWFCLNNVVVNTNLNDMIGNEEDADSNSEDTELYSLSNSAEKFDQLYSILLLSTSNHVYKDEQVSMTYLSNILSKLKELINWSLLKKFPFLQKTIAEVLMKLLISCYKSNNLTLYFLKIGISSKRLAYVQDLILNEDFHTDLKTVLRILVMVDYKTSQDSSMELPMHISDSMLLLSLEPFLTSSLDPIRDRLLTTMFLESNNEREVLNLNTLDFLISPDFKENTDFKSVITQSSNSSSWQHDTKELVNSIFTLAKDDSTVNKYETNINHFFIASSIGRCACLLSGDYKMSSKSCSACESSVDETIYIADSLKMDRPLISDNESMAALWELFHDLYLNKNLEDILKDEFLTISLLISIRRILSSFRCGSLIKKEKNLWKFLKLCFTSIIREVRLLTVRILPLLLYVVEDDQYETNFDLIVKYIGSFKPKRETAYLFEVIIMAWAEFVLVSNLDEKLYVLLYPLINYLGDEDQFRNNMAFHELRMIATTKGITPWQLVEPFIPYISTDLIYKRTSHPTLLFNFCNFVRMDIEIFLTRTQEYTIPRFIQFFKEDHIGFIASQVKKPRLSLIDSNFSKILATLLTSENKIDANKIMKIIVIANPELKKFDLPTLVSQVDCLNLACEILCLYNSDDMKTRISNAITFIAVSRNDPTNMKTKKQILTSFFDTIMLGLAQWFSSKINETRGTQPFVIKIQAIKAIMCLAEIASGFEAGLPQIMACLQVALESYELRLDALKCLHLVVTNLSANSLPIILDFLISFILQKYELFNEKCKVVANSILNTIFEDQFGLIARSYSSYAYSLPSSNEQFEQIKQKFKKYLWNREAFIHDLDRRCKEDNHWIVLQALDDLIEFLQMHEVDFHLKHIHDRRFFRIISELFSTVLQTSHRLSSTNKDIPYKCARVLSYFGALDFDKLNLVSKSKKRKHMILIDNLCNNTELIEFIAYFLNNILIKTFVSSNDPQRQLFLAFCMQEFMKLLGVHGTDVNDHLNAENIDGIFETMWKEFSTTTKIVIKPLFNSKYLMKNFNYVPRKFPLFKSDIKYSVWLQAFAEDLLKRSGDLEKLPKQPQSFFLQCSIIIKNQDLVIAEFLLPYVALSSIISGDEKIASDIKTELISILKTDIDDLVNDSARESLRSSYRCVFSIIDYFNEWISARKRSKGYSISERERVEEFVNELPMELLAKRTAQCNSYERAVLLLEKSYLNNKIDKHEFFTSVRSMYAEIDDIDALHGVLKTFSTDSLSDKLLQFQYSNDWGVTKESLEALVSFDFKNISTTVSGSQLIGDEKVKQDNMTSLLNCLEEHCDYDGVLNKLKVFESSSHLSKSISRNKDLVLSGLQASIFSDNIDEINHWLKIAENYPSALSPGSEISIYYEFIQALSSLNSNNIDICKVHLLKAIDYVGISLAISKDISQPKVSKFMTLLHCLYDFELMIRCKDKHSLDATLKLINSRSNNTSKDFKVIWKIHLMKQTLEVLHPESYVRDDLKNTLVESCAILREEGMLDLATKTITGALLTGAQSVDLEYSKLLWAQGDHSQALKIIKQLISSRKSRGTAEIQLTYTEWLETSANGSSEDIIKGYNNAISLDVDWSKPQYCLGRYYNKLLDASLVDTPGMKKPEKDFYGNLELGVIKAYLRSIIINDDYLFEVLPKVVTIWLDYTTKNYKSAHSPYSHETIASKRLENYHIILKFIEVSLSDSPKYKWYTVLSQLISRMIHHDPGTGNLILKIITELARSYPDVVLYSVYSQVQSTVAERVVKGKEICKALQTNNNDLFLKQVQSAFTLLEALKGICSINLQKTKKSRYNLWDELRFSYGDFECRALVMPLKVNFQINIPSTGMEKIRGDFFPSEKKIRFQRFDPRVQILSSMQRPRKISIVGTDGRKYSILCKPNDDLRKDAKLMEFVTVIDRLLRNDRESEKRNLEIKSYAVTPLNEEMGIIEMVDNVKTMREILVSYLSRQHSPLDIVKAKDLLNDKLSVEEKITNFGKLVKTYPPVLQNWFFDQFPDPSSWYIARNTFIRSSAVMSIVGYLVGMGDRHGDNILLKEDTGSVLHVDFDCLFDKGKRLAIPERVPFRLTQNMVSACGVNGVEGTFRKTCEVTTSLLRNNENMLMNVLETFLYDPIMDWKVKPNKKRRGAYGDTNESLKPQEAMATIRRKIRGVLDPKDLDTGAKDSGGLAVSVSAQVDAVIQQATSTEALAQMYIGWMAFL